MKGFKNSREASEAGLRGGVMRGLLLPKQRLQEIAAMGGASRWAKARQNKKRAGPSKTTRPRGKARRSKVLGAAS